MGLLRPDVLAVAVALFVLVVEPKEREFDSPEVPAVDDDAVGLRFLYLEPGYPGPVGSSRATVAGFLDSINTTRRMSGRNCGSDWVHSSPSFMHIII